MEKKLEKKKISKNVKIINIIIWILFSCINLYALVTIKNIKLIPDKYFMIIAAVIIGISLLFGMIVIISKYAKKFLIILSVIMVIIGGCELYACVKVRSLTTFLNNNINSKYITNVYYVIANSESKYNTLDDISGKEIYYYEDQENEEELINNIYKNINNAKAEKEEDINKLFSNITKNKDYVAVINSGNYESMGANDEKIDSKIKILGTFEIKSEVIEESTKNEISGQPFVIFINGIDTRSGKLPARSLSDVNIVMAVNTKTKNILMVHIPRDYYVSVHGKNGKKDKLTHTGTIGGVNLTMSTVEDLLNIKISNYARFNFNAVINLVDAIGGIDVYSDVDYSFNSYNIPALVINPGMNHLNGNEALAFAKERHAYASGDRHRGENQEQVIQRVIEKATSNATLITKFDDILASLNGTFETSLTLNEISSLVNESTTNSSKKWTIENCNLTGTDAHEYTLSYTNQKLYVMKPDTNTIKIAVDKLNNILEK